MCSDRPKAGRPVPTQVFKPKVVPAPDEQEITETTPIKPKATSSTKGTLAFKAGDSTAVKDEDPKTPVKKDALVPFLST